MSGAEPARGSRSGDRARGRAGSPRRSAQAPARRRRTGDPARRAAFDVLREVAESDAYANLALPPMLTARGITGRDAAFATELAYGTLRLRGRYDAVIARAAARPADVLDAPLLDLLRLGAHQVLGMRVPAHAAVSETVGLAREVTGAGAAKLVNAVLRAIAATPLEEWLDRIAEDAGDDPHDRLAVVHSHPAWVVRALHQALVGDGRDPGELEALLEADNSAPGVTLVVRPGLAEREAVLETHRGSAGRWAPTAVVLAAGDPSQVAGTREGRVGVQDEGSQLVALALAQAVVQTEGRAEERWLDLCAGPGGKTALLGSVAVGRDVHLTAVELHPHRAGLVRRSVAALPRDVVDVRQGDGRRIGADEPSTYDRVLLDAPCTGLGALRRRPEARWRRQPADLAVLTALQRDLLGSALDAVRPGGVVAYVTCSPHPAETQLVVRDVLRRRDDVDQLDARPVVRSAVGPSGDSSIPLGPGPWVQLWPHVHGTDAMFLALLRRRPPATAAHPGTGD